MLADEHGLIDPQRIGAIGGSYGGGMSMALGALRNRKVMPDYSLVPWTSPDGKPMQIAAAAPNIPWTDLAYSLAPNGSTLDYVADAPYRGRVGVEKQSLRRRPLRLRARRARASTRPPAPTRPPTWSAGGPGSRRASRTAPTCRRSSTRSPSTTPRTTSTTRSRRRRC